MTKQKENTKMKKSVVSRLKITPNNKILRRKMAVCHFRTKKSKKNILTKKKYFPFDFPVKNILNYKNS